MIDEIESEYLATADNEVIDKLIQIGTKSKVSHQTAWIEKFSITYISEWMIKRTKRAGDV